MCFFKGPCKVNKEEEAKVMLELLRDDFIDDPSFVPDVRQCPVKLPLKNCKHLPHFLIPS